MKPSEKFGRVIWLTRLFARACGADVADKNYKVNFITFLVAFCITVYFIFSIYTVHIKLHESWGTILESFCMVGSVLQGISKLMFGIVYTRIVSKSTYLLIDLYTEYETKGKEYEEALHKTISRIEKLLKSAAGVYTTVVPLLMTIPFFVRIFTGRRVFAMQFYIPRLDPDTLLGYNLTLGMQLTCLFFGGFGNFAGDMFMFVFFAHNSLFVEILKLKTKELNALSSEVGNPEVRRMLLDVLKWHQMYSEFTADNDACFYWINFTQITTSGVSIVLTLFIMFTGDWPGCYPYLLLSFSMLHFYCFMGTMVEVANDNIIVEMYAIHWYNLSIDHQKIVGFMLMMAQSPKAITVGGVVPLSVSTGLQVTKTVYSVFMMLLNFFT